MAQCVGEVAWVFILLPSASQPPQPASSSWWHLALDEAAEGRDPSKSHSRVSTARAAGVDALKGAVARATPRAASELLCRASSQLAPRDLPTATLSAAPVASAAASELVLGPKDAHGHGRQPHGQQRPSTWPWPQPRKRKLSVAQKSPAERTFAQFAERLSFLTILDNFFTTNYRYHRDQKTEAFQCRTITAPGRKHSSREPP